MFIDAHGRRKSALNNIRESGIGLWNEEDEFYYDVLIFPKEAWFRSLCDTSWNERKWNISARVGLFKKGA